MWRDLVLVAKKEWRQSVSNKEISFGMSILPVYLGIVLPLGFGSIPIPGFIESFIPLILILILSFVGTMGSSIFVVYAFAGEREANTLQTLLTTRLSDSALVFGKMLFALLMAIAMNFVTFAVFMATLSIRIGSFPDAFSPLVKPEILFGILVVPLLFALFSISVGMLISTKIMNTKTASGVSILPEMPVIGLFGWLLIGNPLGLTQFQNILAASAILVALASIFLVFTLGFFKRERMIAK